MGVMSGDIAVGSIPGVIQIATFMEYQLHAAADSPVSFEFRLLQDDTEIVKAGMTSHIPAGQSANLILPRALMNVEKAVKFRTLASVNNGPEEEIVNRRIFVPAPATS
jgi:hypothetical protein